PVPLRLINPFHAEDTVNALDGGEDAVELAAVLDFQVDFNARAQIVRVRFERTNIGPGLADGAGDFREHAGAVLGEHQEARDELAFGGAGPFHVDAALGFVEQVLDVRAIAVVDGHATAARDIADDFVAGNGVAALGAVDEQIVLPAHLDGGLAESQGFFDRAHKACGLFNRGNLLCKSFWNYFLYRLARGDFSVAQSGVEVFGARAAVLRGDLGDGLVVDALERDAEIARFLFQQAAAEFCGLLAFVQVDPVANFAAGAGAVDEAEPVAAGR